MSSILEKYIPTARVHPWDIVNRLIFGAGAYVRVGKEAKRLAKGSAKVLLVTDKGVEKAGLLGKVKLPLEEEGHNVTVFNRVGVEPTLESLRDATAVVRGDKFDVVVGLGGGSAMDTAKTAAITATNPEDVGYYYAYLEDRVKEKSLPKIMIATTSGTGSEVSVAAVATDEKGTKNFITSPYAKAEVAIVDPLMTVTCPPRVTAGAGMDALAHLVEAFITAVPTPLTDAFALHGTRLVASNLRRAYSCGDDLEARYNMAIAATLGGFCTPIIPSNIGHCLSEAIGPLYNVPHGVANAIVTPYQMEYNLPMGMERIAFLAQYLNEDIHGLSTRQAALKAIEAVKNLVMDLELPISLKEVNVPKEDLPKLAERIVKDLQFPYDLPTLNPRKLSMENVTMLLEKMWAGEVRKN